MYQLYLQDVKEFFAPRLNPRLSSPLGNPDRAPRQLMKFLETIDKILIIQKYLIMNRRRRGGAFWLLRREAPAFR
jgi:hypothetical protein